MDWSHWVSEDFWRVRAEQLVAWALRAIPASLVVLVLGAILWRLVDFGCRRLDAYWATQKENAERAELLKRSQTLVALLRRIGKIIISVLVLLILLSQFGVNVAPLLASAGVVGLAVGFGAQELVKDFFFGFFLLLEDNIRIGDVAIINGTGGLVESVGLRTIVLRDLSGVVHVFRNGSVQTLANMTKEWSAMVFDIGVAYKEDTDRVAEVMAAVAKELSADEQFGDKILEPLEIFGVDAFGDSAVVIKARLKTVPMQQWSVGREYRRRLKKAFDVAGVEIPFPHRTLNWNSASPPLQLLPSAVTGDG